MIRAVPLLLIVAVFILPSVSQARNYKVHSISEMGKKKKTMTTQWDDGFVVLPGGERKDGQIQIKVMNDVDTVEVRFRADDKAKDKLVYARNEIERFGLKEDLATDFAQKQNPFLNFQPGYVVLRDGTRLNGRVAAVARPMVGWWLTMARYTDSTDKVSELSPAQVRFYVQRVDGGDHVFESYADGYFERLADGDLVLIRNPRPTTKAGGLSHFVVSQARDVAAQEAAKATAEASIRAGVAAKADLGETVHDAVANAASTQQGIESINVLDYEKEFLIRPRAGGDFVALNRKKFGDYVKTTYASCPAFTALDPNRQKELMDWDKIVESISWYNSSCGK